MAVTLFHQLVIAHIVTGSVGLICIWVPIVSRKGGVNHKRWGKVFAYSMLLTGGLAIGISLCTLAAPLETHEFSDDAAFVRGIFGWMMLYLAIMTIMLAWYGLLCIRNRRRHQRNRNPLNLVLQLATFAAAEWLIQHTRGLVGAGISVYTAFLAFGAVNLLPAYAFNPFVWAAPTVLGVSLLLYHQFRITAQR